MRDHPPCDASLRAAVTELAASGLPPHDIGSLLRIDPAAIRRLIAAEDTQAAAMCAVAWSIKTNRLEAR